MNVTQKKNMANKPVDETISVEEVDVYGEVDYVIVPIPFSIRCKDDLFDFSDRTGIGTCLSLTRLGQTAGIYTDIASLIKEFDLGEVKTPTVICPQCHGLPQKIQELLMIRVLELHDRGINVIFVKDGIEFRAKEKKKSVLERALKHIGLYRAWKAMMEAKRRNRLIDQKWEKAQKNRMLKDNY